MNSKSTYFIIFYCSLTLCSWIIVTQAYPADGQHLSLDSSESLSNELLQDSSNSNEQETLVRNKRTIGFLRQLFPGLSQIIDRKIQQITRVIFRVVGRLILRGGAAGGAAGGAGGGDSSSGDGKGGRRVSITLPTYPPFEDEEEEDNTDAPTSEKDSASSDQSTIRVNVSSTTASPSGEELSTVGSERGSLPDIVGSSAPPITDANMVTEAQDSNTIRRINRDVSDVLSDTTLSVSVDEPSSTTEAPKKSNGFLSRLREMRSKRGLFRFGSGGGSGNFLFDIIRLIAGSGTSPEKDEEQNAPRDEREGESIDTNDVNGSSSNYNDDSYTAGIPGPLTRLFILANRGISNLIQDLILLCPDAGEHCQRNMTVIVNKVAENIHKQSPTSLTLKNP